MCAAYKFPAGHSIRVIISNADFPVIWPSPHPMTTTLYTGGDRPSHVLLPVLSPQRYVSGTLPILADSIQKLQQGERSGDTVADYRLSRNFVSGIATATFELSRELIECQVHERNPAEASVQVTAVAPYRAADGRVIESRATGTLRSTMDHFFLDIATALLHREHPGTADFSLKEIEARLARERLTDDTRPGVYPHLSVHCVANRSPNGGRYRMLFQTAPSRRRLFRPGDPYHPERERGKVAPDRTEIPPKRREALRGDFTAFHAGFPTELGICVPREYWLTVGVRV